jgi:DNA-binding transcriptional regulator YhcF (GntR family)
MASDFPERLGIAIDRDAELPVGVQLTWSLRALILTGALRRGDRLPALHRLAEELGVNANTVRAVYRRLEQEGLVETRHGTGTFVREGPGSAASLATAVATAARAAGEAGVPARELAAALYVAAAEESSPSPAADRRRRLRAEIAILDRSLTDLRIKHRLVVVPVGGQRRPNHARLLSADELEDQRDEVLRQLLAAQAEADRPPDPREKATATPQAPASRAKPARSRARTTRLQVAPEKS